MSGTASPFFVRTPKRLRSSQYHSELTETDLTTREAPASSALGLHGREPRDAMERKRGDELPEPVLHEHAQDLAGARDVLEPIAALSHAGPARSPLTAEIEPQQSLRAWRVHQEEVLVHGALKG